jgi:hypothetical protein
MTPPRNAPCPCGSGKNLPTPDDLADILDLLDLLAPGRSEPIDPEHVRRVRRVVEGWGMGVSR